MQDRRARRIIAALAGLAMVIAGVLLTPGIAEAKKGGKPAKPSSSQSSTASTTTSDSGGSGTGSTSTSKGNGASKPKPSKKPSGSGGGSSSGGGSDSGSSITVASDGSVITDGDPTGLLDTATINEPSPGRDVAYVKSDQLGSTVSSSSYDCPVWQAGYDGWHFVLPTTSTTFETLYVTFIDPATGGEVDADHTAVSGKHAWAYSPTGQGYRLASAWAYVNGSQTWFPLSHTCGWGAPSPSPSTSPTDSCLAGDDCPTPTPTPTPTTSVTPTPTGSVTAACIQGFNCPGDPWACFNTGTCGCPDGPFCFKTASPSPIVTVTLTPSYDPSATSYPAPSPSATCSTSTTTLITTCVVTTCTTQVVQGSSGPPVYACTVTTTSTTTDNTKVTSTLPPAEKDANGAYLVECGVQEVGSADPTVRDAVQKGYIVTITNQPAKGKVTLTSDGRFIYTPSAGACKYGGDDRIQYTITDPRDGSTRKGNLSLAIQRAGDVPSRVNTGFAGVFGRSAA